MNRKFLAILLTLSMLLALLPATALASEPMEDTLVTIFATNDLHGNVAHSDSAIGLAQAAAIKASTPCALLVDAGDATQGASFATISKGEDVIKVMNAAGYDAMAAGNHDFDYGADVLLANAEAADFPILAANVTQDGKTMLEASCIKEAGGKKIGFIGLTTAATATSTNPAQLSGIEFQDEIQTAVAQIHALEDQTDAIVLICHMGENGAAVPCTSKQLLTLMDEMDPAACDAVTAVIDGHSHETYADAYEDIPIVQAGVNGTAMGRVELLFTGDASVSAWGSVLTYDKAMAYELPDAGLAAAAKVEETLSGIQEGQKAVLSEKLSENTAPLWGGYIYYDYVESRIVETAYGDFVTDAFADSARAFAKNNSLDLPVVAVENGGGIGQTMPMGSVTRGDILNAFNHGNLVVALSVTPAQLYTALELGLTMTGQDDTGLLVRERVSGSFLQASGFSYTYDPAGAAGTKVTQVTLDGGKQLSRDDTTTRLLLATNNYVATFAGLKDGEQRGELGGEDLIVEEYLLSQTADGALDYPMTQGRIQIANDKSPETYDVSIPVLSAADKTTPLAGVTVHLKVDDGAYTEMTTGADGALAVKGLAKGPHQFFLQEAEGQAVYVNNYSGSGTVTTREGYYRLGFLAEAGGGLPFTDVAGDSPYYGGVAYAYRTGLMAGVSGTSFDPDGITSRAMAVGVLWNLAEKPVVNYLMQYTDVPEGLWYSESIRWASSTCIAGGRGDGTFGPDAPVTREQLAAVIYQYEQFQGGGFTGEWMFRLDYPDLADVSDWASEAVAWCVMNGILFHGESLVPQGQVTRAELAQAIAEYAQLG